MSINKRKYLTFLALYVAGTLPTLMTIEHKLSENNKPQYIEEKVETDEHVDMIIDNNQAYIINLNECVVGKLDECDGLVIYTTDGQVLETSSPNIILLPNINSLDTAYDQANEYGINTSDIQVYISEYNKKTL